MKEHNTIADIIETPKDNGWQCIPIIKAWKLLDYIEETTKKTNIENLRKLQKTIPHDKYLDECGARELIKNKDLNIDHIEAFELTRDLKKATTLIYTKTNPEAKRYLEASTKRVVDKEVNKLLNTYLDIEKYRYGHSSDSALYRAFLLGLVYGEANAKA